MDESPRTPPRQTYKAIMLLRDFVCAARLIYMLPVLFYFITVKTNSFTVLESAANYSSDEVIAIERRRMAESFFSIYISFIIDRSYRQVSIKEFSRQYAKFPQFLYWHNLEGVSFQKASIAKR